MLNTFSFIISVIVRENIGHLDSIFLRVFFYASEKYISSFLLFLHIQRLLAAGLCHIFSHLGQSRKCHSTEQLAASACASSGAQNRSSLKPGRGKKNRKNNKTEKQKLSWVTSSFSARLLLLVTFGLAARRSLAFFTPTLGFVLSWFHTRGRCYAQYRPTLTRVSGRHC